MRLHLLLLGLLLSAHSAAQADDPLFSRDILPLLSEKCFACHGPDPSHRKADLRLDTREDALKSAIVPGEPASSELLRRVRSTNPEEIMPPPDAHSRPLTPEQTERLQRWIAAGAPWGKHWAFEPPVKVDLAGDQHPIDAFINQRLQLAGLQPAPEAPPHTLLRRLSFDLTGLPPTQEELDSADSYEAHVDRLLKSPHYGERMAMWWLDVARYSDTDGFQSDASRDNWPWRDWVIDAVNAIRINSIRFHRPNTMVCMRSSTALTRTARLERLPTVPLRRLCTRGTRRAGSTGTGRWATFRGHGYPRISS